MKRWLRDGLLMAIVLAGTVAFLPSRKAVNEIQTTASTTDLQIVRLMLGDDYEKVRQQSTFQFPRRQLDQLDMIGASVPVIFEYTTRPFGFPLPWRLVSLIGFARLRNWRSKRRGRS